MARRDSGTAFAHLAETVALVSHGQPGHIVDTLIAERGTRIVEHPLWPVMRPFLYTILNYRRAIEFADAVANMPGFQAFEFLSSALKLDVAVRHEERIPEKGGFLLASAGCSSRGAAGIGQVELSRVRVDGQQAFPDQASDHLAHRRCADPQALRQPRSDHRLPLAVHVADRHQVLGGSLGRLPRGARLRHGPILAAADCCTGEHEPSNDGGCRPAYGLVTVMLVGSSGSC